MSSRVCFACVRLTCALSACVSVLACALRACVWVLACALRAFVWVRTHVCSACVRVGTYSRVLCVRACGYSRVLCVRTYGSSRGTTRNSRRELHACFFNLLVGGTVHVHRSDYTCSACCRNCCCTKNGL